MDGPQLRQRWSAYHATVLADDPGSSVLTLTSLGMAKLSQPRDQIGSDPKTIIALWRDPITGIAEIALPPNARAAILTLSRHNCVETSADFRDHWLELGAPVYGGRRFLHERCGKAACHRSRSTSRNPERHARGGSGDGAGVRRKAPGVWPLFDRLPCDRPHRSGSRSAG
jgi:hypothetical protein